ncbi:hypothetical protein GGC03_09205 [Vibrio sp. THAF191c]|nr:hypothetical protein FIU99_09185 [Vibrio sp. THAF64]QGM34508.1 hypothetical protein GGC04_09200 [Vibrio sp. THAF191d]QGN70010.1 hypothetical protein GGC03_09205 [Vibrio sp. THAF191c]
MAVYFGIRAPKMGEKITKKAGQYATAFYMLDL